MIVNETNLNGAFMVDLELKHDECVVFFRTWCQREFEAHGFGSRLLQRSGVYNRKKGTWRGMRWRAAPHEEAKLIRVVAGAVYDVIAHSHGHV